MYVHLYAQTSIFLNVFMYLHIGHKMIFEQRRQRQQQTTYTHYNKHSLAGLSHIRSTKRRNDSVEQG